MVVLAWVAAHCCWLVVDRCCSVDCCYCYCYCFFVVDDVAAVLVDVNCVPRKGREVLAAFVAAAIAGRSVRGRQNHAERISVDGWVNLAWRVYPVDFFGRLRNCCSPFGDRVDCDAFCVVWDFYILERERGGYGFVEGDFLWNGVVLFVDFFDNFTDSLKMENRI